MADLAVIDQPTVKVAIVYNPFNAKSIEHKELVHNPDFTLADYLDGLPDTTTWVVGHNGKSYEKEDWASVKLQPDEGFSLVNVPEGGGGKDILRIVALLAVVVASIYLGPEVAIAFGYLGTGTAAAIAGATIAIAGAMLVSAVLPPSLPSLNNAISDQSPATYGYDGAKNTSTEGIVVPVVYGEFRVGGNVVDLFTKNVGDDQYLFMRTVLNDGEVEDITDLEINNEPIANFSNVDTRISYGTDDGQTNDWFGESVRQVNQAVKLSPAFWTYTTSDEIERFRLAFICPNGLVEIDTKSGDKVSTSVTVEIQVRPTGADDDAWAGVGATALYNIFSYNQGATGLSGYSSPPLARSATGGYTQSFGNIINPATGAPLGNGLGVLLSSYFTTQIITDGAYGTVQVPAPLTGDNEYTLKVDVPAGVNYITVEGLAELYTKASGDLSGSYHMKAAWRAAGGDWQFFGEDSGSVTRIRDQAGAGFNLPMVYRTWSTQIPTDGVEVAVFGGSPTNLSVSVATDDAGVSSGFTLSRAQTSAVRYDFESTNLPLGQYDIRVRRFDVESTDVSIQNAIYVQDVSEILLENVQYVGTANVSMKIKMTDQLASAPTFTAKVKGCLVNSFDSEGNIVDHAWSPWPCWHLADVLMNENRGRGLSSSLIDWPAFKGWEQYCINNNIRFNMAFDKDSNVFDTAQTICRTGHAALVRVGTKWSVVVDQPSEAVMMFNESNIIKGSFKSDWLPLADRANEVQYTYWDEDNGNAQTLLRVTDPNAPNTGAGLRVAQVNGYGVTNIEQARNDVTRMIRENALLKKTITFDAPLEAVGLAQGDVAIIQHTAANYGRGIGGGRLKPGNTTTHLKLDAPVTMEAGKTYSALVIHPAIKRYDVTIVSTNAGSVFVEPFAGEIDRVTRLVQGSHDVAIIDIQQGNPNDRIVVEDQTGFVAGAAELWVTDLVEERTVVNNIHTPLTEVDLTTALSAAPQDYSIWMVGPFETVKQKYRLRTISGQNILQRTLTFTDYNELLYAPLDITITPPAVTPRAPVAQAFNLSYSYPETFVGNTLPILVNFTWQAGDPANYAGADIYLKLNQGSWTYVRSLQGVTNWQTQMNAGDDFQFRVVEFDLNNRRANASFAPTVGTVISQTALALEPPTNLLISLQDFLVQATVFVTWDASPSHPIDGYLVEYINVTEDQYKSFNAGTYTPPDDTQWNIAGLAPGLTETIVQNNIGWLIVRVRAQYGQSVSPYLTRAFYLNAPTVPGRVTGLTLENAVGDPLNGIFTGRDAKFSWRDVAYLASSLAETGADVNGMDFTFKDYEVRIKSPAGQELRRETTNTPYYIYTHEKNVEDSAQIWGTLTGAAHRSFIIEVRLRGRQGQLSDAAWMEVSNPPPNPIAGVLIPKANTFQLDIVRPADTDFVGLLVYADTVPNFTASPANKVWEGGGVPVWVADADTTYYVKWAGYDAFGQDELIYCLEQEVTLEGITAAALAAGLIDDINALIATDMSPGGVLAKILQVQNTLETADSALSSQIDAVVAIANGNEALIASEQTARADADSAMAEQITAVVATAGANSAAITSEQTARTDADSSLASSISSISSTVDGHTSTITTYGTSINGILARYGVSLDVNGYVVGWSLNNNSNSGTMIVRADTFAVGYPGNSTNYPFVVSGGRVYIDTAFIASLDAGKVTFGTMSGDRIAVNTLTGDRIIADTITVNHLQANSITTTKINDSAVSTGKIASQAVSNSVASVGTTTTIGHSPTWVTLASVSITTNSGNILISFTDSITWSVDSPRGTYRVRRDDGTIMNSCIFGGGTVPDGLIVAGTALDTTAGSGSRGYVLEATTTANTGISQGAALVVTELKR